MRKEEEVEEKEVRWQRGSGQQTQERRERGSGRDEWYQLSSCMRIKNQKTIFKNVQFH